MNSLSWLLYAADVSNGLMAIFVVITIVSALFGFIVAGHLYLDLGDGPKEWILSGKSEDAKARMIKAHEDSVAGCKSMLKVFLITGVVSAFLSALIPSRETVYAIAASEMGEEIVKSATAGKAMKALNAWLDKQVEGTGE